MISRIWVGEGAWVRAAWMLRVLLLSESWEVAEAGSVLSSPEVSNVCLQSGW